MDRIKVVNIIPNSLSGETNQDSEPNLAVNPNNTDEMAATAFTPNPGGGADSPIFISNDGGNTWSLAEVIAGTPVRDQTIRFDGSGNDLYGGILWGSGSLISAINFDILRIKTSDLFAASPPTMTRLATRTSDDQPYIQAATVPSGPDAGKDRIYIGSNDHAPSNIPATIDDSMDAAAASPTISTVRLESRTVNRDGFQTRPAVHNNGTVYAVFYAWVSGASSSDVVIVRDDNWGKGSTPFQAIVDSGDSKNGVRIVTGRNVPAFNTMGQQRIGGDLSIAVDPNNSSNVYVVWGDQNSGTYTLHMRKSTNGGATWPTTDLKSVSNATNPAVAITGSGRLGFLYQLNSGTYPNDRWQTKIELTTNDFATSPTTYTLADTPAESPSIVWNPYIGDYISMMAVGETFYGIFCANNTPDHANFPNGITFQRNADWTSHVLKDLHGNAVSVSIDPFFFSIGPSFKIIKELKPEIKEWKELWLEGKWRIPDKLVEPEKIIFEKLKDLVEGPKLDEKLDEVFQPGYLGDPEILRIIAQRIDAIEEEMSKGKSFITEEERPSVGEEPLKRARKKQAEK